MLVFCMQNVAVGQLDITHTAWQTICMCDVDIFLSIMHESLVFNLIGIWSLRVNSPEYDNMIVLSFVGQTR